MINFTPKVEPSNRVTNYRQLKHGHTYLVNGDPYIYSLNNGNFHFVNFQTGRINYDIVDNFGNHVIVPADFELIEIDEAGA